ncbi:hypothetical protein B0H17DRAFT_1135733 [Mycena rosella]|uniref:CxC1-like cysteine cluster associated with KDZ transposases domain-containing protein n=1 Tax=Mycena rosella TaxID=1033263 RepID=A0AAD7GCL9_MYCRO|nr:hypothetical protein B0H17DRAFT_1135733 [Mycena rosella]
MGLAKMTKREKAHAMTAPTSAWTPVLVEGPRNTHYLKKPKAGQEPLVYLVNNRTLIQQLVPASSHPHLFSNVPTVSDDLLASDDLGHYDFDDDQFDTTPESPQKECDNSLRKRRHRENVASQGTTWQLDVILHLITSFARLWHKTHRLRDANQLVLPNREKCGCRQSIMAKISVLQFTKIMDITTWTCECAPAPQQLLAAGLFPSAPLHLHFAVNMRVLEFAMKLFIWIAPNNTAWCTTIQSFLSGLGFSMANEGSIRKLFRSMLEWYMHLHHQVNQHYDDMLERIRRYHFLDAVTSNNDSDGNTVFLIAPPVGVSDSWEIQKNARDTTPEIMPDPFPEPPPRTRPSNYWHRCCPACFGGLNHDPSVIADALVCIDACFAQKRNTRTVDSPKTHPTTHFVYEGLSAQMQDYVDPTVVEVEDKRDDYEHPALLLPPSVLNGCKSSFKAADERREKASTQFYEDTALMALLCRHDRFLWLVNMRCVGEKQFYMYLLIETLFQHLPPNIMVGLLYNVMCQLERSARKWGFLDRYIDCLAFAVAVFHAFGHEWACQVLTILANTQIQQADEANLFKLAEWLRQQTLHSATKCQEAQDVVDAGQSKCELKQNLKPVSSLKAVAAVLASRDAVAIHKTQVMECEAVVLDAIDDNSGNDIVHCKVALETAQAALKKAKERLTRQELALGIGNRAALTKLGKSKYFELRMNAQALKTRLRDQRKLLAHTDSAMKWCAPHISRLKNNYNKLCDAISLEIKHKRAPRGGLAPEHIESKALDVDDAIWQDVSLQDEEEQEVPLWLRSDMVRSGIRAMLDLDRSKEEDCQLEKERESLQVWFAEEWTVVNEAMRRTADDGDRYQFFIWRERLLRLCGTWCQYMPIDAPGDTPWGLSDEELLASLLESRKAGRREDAYDAAEEETEEEFETLDAMDTVGAYQEPDRDVSGLPTLDWADNGRPPRIIAESDDNGGQATMKILEHDCQATDHSSKLSSNRNDYYRSGRMEGGWHRTGGINRAERSARLLSSTTTFCPVTWSQASGCLHGVYRVIPKFVQLSPMPSTTPHPPRAAAKALNVSGIERHFPQNGDL